MKYCNLEKKIKLWVLSAKPAKGNFEATYCFKMLNPKHFVKEYKVNISHIGLFYFGSEYTENMMQISKHLI